MLPGRLQTSAKPSEKAERPRLARLGMTCLRKAVKQVCSAQDSLPMSDLHADHWMQLMIEDDDMCCNADLARACLCDGCAQRKLVHDNHSLIALLEVYSGLL